MEFIQSQVYPNLYLVKNPDKDKNIVRQAIKEFILQLKHSQLVHKNGASKKIQFYEYTTGDLGENGTAYFLKHKERADGMTAELLEYYPDYLLATFSIPSCGEGSTSNYGTLAYYKDRNIIKTDTLINLCKK